MIRTYKTLFVYVWIPKFEIHPSTKPRLPDNIIARRKIDPAVLEIMLNFTLVREYSTDF